MNITLLAIRNNRTTLVLLVLLILSGIQAFVNMPRAYDPGFVIRTAQVIAHFPGAGPKRVEELVSDKLEKVIQEIPEVDFIKSESRTGVSIISVNIKESYTDMRPIWDNLRRKIDEVKSDLPEGVIGPIVKDDLGDVFGIVLTLTGEGYSYAELKQVAEEARNEFLRVGDVAKVDIYGGQEEHIFVEYTNSRLSDLNLSPTQLAKALSSRNIVVSGGAITLGGERIELEPTGNYESVEDIGQTIIQLPGSSKVVYLRDIAEVKRGYVDPPTTKVRSSGFPALGLAISMREGGNNIVMGEGVRKVLTRLQSVYPIGIEFEVINFSPEEVEDKVNTFASNLLQAIGVVAAVMLVSLGFRTGLVVATLIPASMVATILVMSFLDIGLDQISLAALIIALGMLVDNGIVMSESIMVQMADGKKPFEAAVDSANELKMSLLTSSLTTSAAFLPIFLAESSMGEFTASLFKVVTITLLCSWILSLTVIPLFCVSFLKVKKQQTDFKSKIYLGYRRLLGKMLRYGYVTVLVVVLLFGLSIKGLGYLPTIFFPPSDRLYFKMELEMPLGTAIEQTEKVVKQFEQFVDSKLKVGDKRTEGVTSWISYIGSGGPRFVLVHSPMPASSNYSLFVLNTTSSEIIDDLMKKLDRYSFDHFPDLRLKLKRIENGGAIVNPVEVRLYGQNEDKLFSLVKQVKEQMAGIPGLKNVSDDWGLRIKKLMVTIDQARALRAGVTSEDIAVSLQTGLSGITLTQYREKEEVIPVLLRSVAADRQDIGKLEALSVYSQATGSSVPLKQVADIEVVWEPAKILRRDRFKTVTIGAQTQPGVTSAQGFAQLKPWLKAQQQDWGVGYRYELGGEAESSSKANKSIMAKLPIGLFIIIVLLVAQFNSLRKPLIILTTIPLAVIGVVVGLFIGGSYFGFMTLLGIISLAGIVINNAIVLLERIQQEIEVNGLSPQQAIIEAAQRRMRPILLTTATTVLGLIPLYLGGGEMWEPMAITIIGGLLFSTILTLGVVPVLYSLFYRVSYKDFQLD